MSKFFIILFLYLPLSSANAATKKPTLNEKQIRKQLQANPQDSYALMNLAIVQMNANKIGHARASIEQSIFLNPLSFSAKKIKTQILNKASELPSGVSRAESISATSYLMDYIPPSFPLIGVVIFSILFAFSLAQTKKKESISFKKDRVSRLQTLANILGLLFFFGVYGFKKVTTAESWGCIVKPQADLFTGPDAKKYTITSSLTEGSCVRVIKHTPGWTSIKPDMNPPGWTNAHNIRVVRGK